MELATEVLARSPVKSLMRFRCVCKAWCSLISSPGFASMHFHRYHNHDDHTLILAATCDGRLRYHWMLLSSHTYERLVDDNDAILNNQHIMDRVNCIPYGSSSNGLLLLCKSTFDPLDALRRTDLWLWNPMIGKTHKITTYYRFDESFYFGFGFSHSRNDYKVLTIVKEPHTSVQVYSLSTCSWKSITEYRESILRGLYSDGFVLVEGTIHFVSDNFKEQSSHMVLFDVNDEIFSYIVLPHELEGRGICNHPVIYHEKIGIFSVDRSNDSCSLWVMENDHLLGSWSKLYKIDLEVAPTIGTLCFKKNGQFMLVTEKGRKLCHIESGEMKHLTEWSSYPNLYCTLYRESLALL